MYCRFLNFREHLITRVSWSPFESQNLIFAYKNSTPDITLGKFKWPRMSDVPKLRTYRVVKIKESTVFQIGPLSQHTHTCAKNTYTHSLLPTICIATAFTHTFTPLTHHHNHWQNFTFSLTHWALYTQTTFTATLSHIGLTHHTCTGKLWCKLPIKY